MSVVSMTRVAAVKENETGTMSIAPVIRLSYYVDISRHMDVKMDTRKAQAAFAALAQPTRLKAFRKLITAHPAGLPAGDIAAFCKVPHNTMSTHLAALLRGGLIAVKREGRSMHYRADVGNFRALINFMMSDCCGGRPDICAPVIDNFNAVCCGAAVTANAG
jgi:DNA-binding transcriptional ArsR family regulator